jgi:hypothetical protein
VNVKQIHEVASGMDARAARRRNKWARVDRVIARSRAVDGDVALSARGHVLLPRWIGLLEGDGQHFLLDTAAVRPGERFGRMLA